MRIGELAAACHCPVETIRYYEKVGLLPAPARLENGYRSYGVEHCKWLRFIVRSRDLGFSQDEVRRLTDLAHRERPACAEVFELLEHHVNDVRERISELRQLENALVRLKRRCHDGTLHDCPVIDELMQ